METRTFLAVAFCVAGTLSFARSASAHDVEKSTWDGTYLFSISVGPVDSSTPAGNLVTAGLHVTQAIDVTRFDETKKGINVSFNVASSNGDAGSCTGEVVGVDFRGWHVTSTCAITSIDGTCTQNLTRDDYFGEDFFGARIERTSLSSWTGTFADGPSGKCISYGATAVYAGTAVAAGDTIEGEGVFNRSLRPPPNVAGMFFGFSKGASYQASGSTSHSAGCTNLSVQQTGSMVETFAANSTGTLTYCRGVQIGEATLKTCISPYPGTVGWATKAVSIAPADAIVDLTANPVTIYGTLHGTYPATPVLTNAGATGNTLAFYEQVKAYPAGSGSLAGFTPPAGFPPTAPSPCPTTP
ncbi:MAG TPA: hypothetical protein VLW85_08815 [Myxococcales bacterium]|nr:hypothetical protein [Myxococcales bacterium]